MINHHCISVCSFKNVVLKYIGAHDTIVDVFLSSFTFVDFQVVLSIVQISLMILAELIRFDSL